MSAREFHLPLMAEAERRLPGPGVWVAIALVAAGLPVVFLRFRDGLAAVTNLSQQTPWGLWIGFDMLSGVALAAGGFTLAATVHIFGLKAFEPVVRPAILTGFLGYLFAVLGLLCDLGQPWRVPYPLFYSFGTTSVMFEVGWCVALYTTVLALEFAPAVLERFGWKGWQARLRRIEMGLIVLGILLSTLHQSSLGSLFLVAEGRLHPLWYSSLLPLHFFVSAVAAGLGMVIVEGALSHKVFTHAGHPDAPVDHDAIAVGLGRAGAMVLFVLFFLRLEALAGSGGFAWLGSQWGALWLFEVVGLILVPSLLLGFAARRGDVVLVRFAAALAVAGVVWNRLAVSIIAFDWAKPVRYVPSALEILVSLSLVAAGVLVFRWAVLNLPVLGPAPAKPAER